MRRLMFPVLLGLAGCAILVALGVWQLQRHEWKQAVLEQIETRIAADPVPLPADPDPEAARYLPVKVAGRLGARTLRVLVSTEELGPGYRIVAPLLTGRRVILADLGFLPLEADPALPEAAVTIEGNLHWPRELDAWTPDPDGDLWFARSVPEMAEELGTEELMVVARTVEGADLPVTPLPVGTRGIPDNHMEYAITWFSLALVWAVMSGYLAFRTIRGKDA